MLTSIPLVTTGGTIASVNRNSDGAMVAKGRDFKSLISEKLRKNDIEISKVYAPYKILSENVTFKHWEKLAKSLIKVIEKEKPKGIVLASGTDSLEKTGKALSGSPCPEQERMPQVLKTLITKLNDLIKKYRVRINITGSNTNNPQEIMQKLMRAFRDITDTRNFLKDAYGWFVSFGENPIPVAFAKKEPNVWREKLGGENGNESMHYTDIRPSGESRSPSLRFQELENVHQFYDNEQAGNIAQSFGKAFKDVDGIIEANLGKTLHLYDVTEVRENHDEFESQLSKESKAVLLVLYHSGTANTADRKASVARLIKRARKKYPNLAFFAVTETGEPVDLTRYKTSVDLRKAGLVPLYDMGKKSALTKLAFLVDKSKTASNLIDEMLNNKTPGISMKINEKHKAELMDNYQVKTKGLAWLSLKTHNPDTKTVAA